MSSIFNSQSSEEIKSKSKSKSISTTSIQSTSSEIDFLERLDEYYRLKNKYDTVIKEKKNSILKDDKLSMKQKREKYKLLKFRCINCERNVNTIFNINDGVLTAICGDKINPCKLNIKINRGKYLDIRTLIDVFETGADDIKEEIISAKLDLLFGYETEQKTIKIFKDLKKELEADLETSAEYVTEFLDIINNQKNQPELQSKLKKFYNYITTIKGTMKEFDETGVLQLIKDVITLYHTELTPLIVDMNRLQYQKKTIEYNDSQQNYHLIRQVYTLSSLLSPFSYPKVESFEIGGDKPRPNTETNPDYSKLRKDAAKLTVDGFDLSEETTDAIENPIEKTKLFVQNNKILIGDKEILDKMDYVKNTQIYSEAPKITATKAHELGYMMEMIYVEEKTPELIAIDKSDGSIYNVVVKEYNSEENM